MPDFVVVRDPVTETIEVATKGPKGDTGAPGEVTQAEFDAHEADTTNVHGIPDTSVLATDADVAAEAATRAAADALLQPLAAKGQANGYAGLDGSAKIQTAALPAIAITSTFVVNSQAAQLALTAQEGDVAVRTDLSQTYIQNGGSAGTMADWTLLATPADAVLSVAGKTGAVSLVKGDVGLGNVDNTSDANKPVSTAQQTALDLKLAKASNLADVASAATSRANLGGTLIATTGSHAARLAAGHVANRLWKETDTNLIYLDDGANWIIWKGDGAVVKTADETVNNSAALQNDDHLFFPIEANEVWYVEAILRPAGSSLTADIQFHWTGPVGATAAWNNVTIISGTASDPGGAQNIGGTITAGLRSGESPVIQINGFFIAAATAGTIQLQWAQNTATAENTTIKAQSHLRLRRVA